MLYREIFRSLRFQKQNSALIILCALCKRHLLSANWRLMQSFVTYVNKNIESTHRECVHFQWSNSMALFTFKNKYFSSCSRFRSHTASTVILIINAHTKQQQDRVFETDFIGSQKSNPPFCIAFGTKLHTRIHNLVPKVMQTGGCGCEETTQRKKT